MFTTTPFYQTVTWSVSYGQTKVRDTLQQVILINPLITQLLQLSAHASILQRIFQLGAIAWLQWSAKKDVVCNIRGLYVFTSSSLVRSNNMVIASASCCFLLGCLSVTSFFSSDHESSIVLRSGLFPGRDNSWTLCSVNHFVQVLAISHGGCSVLLEMSWSTGIILLRALHRCSMMHLGAINQLHSPNATQGDACPVAHDVTLTMWHHISH